MAGAFDIMIEDLAVGEGSLGVAAPVADRPSFSSATAGQKLSEPLTRCEIEILGLLATGLVNKEIASRLFISMKTVKKHTQNIYWKLNAYNRKQAVARAYYLGILSRNGGKR